MYNLHIRIILVQHMMNIETMNIVTVHVYAVMITLTLVTTVLGHHLIVMVIRCTRFVERTASHIWS